MEQLAYGRERLDTSNEPKILMGLFLLYLFLSFFEKYLSVYIGSSTKYLLLVIIGLYLYFNRFVIRLNILSEAIILWFVLKAASLLWSDHSNMDIVRTNVISQIGIVLFVPAITSQVKDSRFLRTALRFSFWCSFAFGVLSIMFRGTYIDERFIARQVLTLWGQQNDPNNCSAFLGIGIGLAAYSLFAEQTSLRMKLINAVVIVVNAYAIILTGSRGGFFLIWALLFIAAVFPNWDRYTTPLDVIRKALVIVALAGASYFIISRFMPSASLARVLAFDEYAEGSGRSIKWKIALNYIKERPLFGQGWGGYVIQDKRAVHNTFLTLWCDTGLVGLVIFMVPLVWILVRAIRTRSLLTTIMLAMGLIPAITIDSINKRYFWNAIILAFLLIDHLQVTGSHVGLWARETEIERTEQQI